ncbi:MAG: DUF4249 domain-containing protein [Prevotellaceae bacterium]|jgi:hypothetical protein|nr:DUF4249 domain-containing protein [Prevotellaceae bacterium]
MALLCAAALAGCENMIKDVDVALADFSPKLVVSASIDTDSGTFRLYFTEARSLAYYKTWQSESIMITGKGTASLYEDDNPVPIYRMLLNVDGASGFSGEQKGLTFKAGSTYKLELRVGEYPVATATAVMPDPPAVEDIALDTTRKVHRRYPYFVGSMGEYVYEDSKDFYPLSLRLTDGSRGRDYYMFRFEGSETTVIPELSYSNTYPVTPYIAVANRALIQDNPDMEANPLEVGTEPDVFLFSRMLMSDMSFANATATIDLLLEDLFVMLTPPTGLCDTTSQPYTRTRTEICISHLSPITYEHHRSLILQRDELGFFTEPVPIASNIENGFGCFAAFSTVRKTVHDGYACSWEMPYY